MKRDDAIHIVDVAFNIPLAVRRAGEDRTYHEAEIREAKRMAITALSQEQQSEWERDHEILKAYADGQESMKPCKDAISRQAAIDAMATWDWQELYLPIHFKQLLEELPSVSTEKTGRWIPVSERLPEIVEWYLTSIKWDDGTERVIISWFDGMSFKAEVKAWMPLPQPYKGESEE